MRYELRIERDILLINQLFNDYSINNVFDSTFRLTLYACERKNDDDEK